MNGGDRHEGQLWSTDQSGEIASRVAPLLSAALLQDGTDQEMEGEVIRGLENLAANAPWAHFASVITGRLRREHVFHMLPARIQDRLDGEAVYQEHFDNGGEHDGPRIATTVRLTGVAAQHLVAALRERWSWWGAGRLADWEERDGDVRVDVRLGRPLGPRLRLALAAATEAEERSPAGFRATKTVFATRYSGAFEGEGTHEVLEISGGCVLRVVRRGTRCRGLLRLLPGEAGLRLLASAEKDGYAGIMGHLQKNEAKVEAKDEAKDEG